MYANANANIHILHVIVLSTIFYLNIQGGAITFTQAFSVFPGNNNKYAPSSVPNVNIEMPDFDVLFDNIREVSPLFSQCLEGSEGEKRIRGEVDCEGESEGEGEHDFGFASADQMYPSQLKWKTMESNKRKSATVSKIEKIDNFKERGCPLIRFRSSLSGPCLGMKFVEYIMDAKERSAYDPQIEVVEQMYPAYDVACANIAMDFKYGDAQLFGIGYTRTKKVLVIDGREQLTLCGVQQFANGGYNIWGIELEERNDHLFPQYEERHVRAKTCLFGITLMPTGRDSFDVEYVLQVKFGGNLPNFVTTPAMVDTIKAMFNYAQAQHSDETYMKNWIKNFEHNKIINEETVREGLSLLITP